jgi:DNA-binding response OmpR family regulator
MDCNATVAASRPRILLIEDELSVAAFLRLTLERKGYEVVSTTSASAGVNLLASGDFQGVISDFRTPGGMNGADVHEWLCRHRPELATRIVFITGDTASPETAALLAKVGTPCVEKPFRVQQFIAVIEKTIGKP